MNIEGQVFLKNLKGIVHVNRENIKEGNNIIIKSKDRITIGRKKALFKVCNYTDYEKFKKIKKQSFQCIYRR